MFNREHLPIINGYVAQLARAFGSYPKCRRFKSVRSHQKIPMDFSVGIFLPFIIQMLRKDISQSQQPFVNREIQVPSQSKKYQIFSCFRCRSGSCNLSLCLLSSFRREKKSRQNISADTDILALFLF